MKKIPILFIITLVLAGAVFGAGNFQFPAGTSRNFNIGTPSAWTGPGGNNAATGTPAMTTATPMAVSPSGVTGTAAGLTGTAAAGSPRAVTAAAASIDEGLLAYDSLTSTADFNYRPAFVESKYEKNELFRDIAVSAVEAVPFGFLLTFAGIFVTEASGQGTLQPQLKTLKDYAPVYGISIGVFAALNVAINTLFYYDYSKEVRNAKKAEEKQALRQLQ